ncbi:MAG: TolB family protein [Anaerolineae bacterium]
MDITEMENRFSQLKQALTEGRLSEEEFKSEVEKLSFHDEQGREWMIGAYSGRWYYLNEDYEWVPGEPPGRLRPVAICQECGRPVEPGAVLCNDCLREAIASAAIEPESPAVEAAPKASRSLLLLVGIIFLLALLAFIAWLLWPGRQEGILVVSSPTATSTRPAHPALPPTFTPSASQVALMMGMATPTPSATSMPSPTPSATSMPSPTPSATSTPSPTPSPTPLSHTPTPAPQGIIIFPVFDVRRGTYDLYLASVDGSGRKLLQEEASQPDLSPDGRKLAFRSWAGERRGLIVRNLDGTQEWRFTVFSEAARPSWSPDGMIFAFHSRQESDRRSRIYRTEGDKIQTIKRGLIDVFGWDPDWMPDTRLVYVTGEGDKRGIWMMNVDGTSPAQLTDDQSDATPAVSPDGSLVAFMSKRDGNWEIYALRISDRELARLTQDGASDILPTWSPDGNYIAFLSDREEGWAVWVMRPDGSGQRRLFPLGGQIDGRPRGAQEYETPGWLEERISWGPPL